MTQIGTTGATRELIERFGLKLKKHYGQNFLVDSHVLNKIVSGGGYSADDTVVEIGAGIGALTERLGETCKRVITYEIDRDLLPVLEEVFRDKPHVEIRNQDFLKADLSEFGTDNEIHYCGNLPYYISSAVIMKILESGSAKSLLVMMQKEVAQRIKSGPGTKDYGILSLAVAFFGDVTVVANVPQNSFIPRPQVDSAVVKISVKNKYPSIDREILFKIIRAAFSTRRKTLQNCLVNTSEFNIDKDTANTWLLSCGMNEKTRGEDLSLDEFIKLYENRPENSI